ncbi:MAG: flagellar M-ring protein FliF [Alphaproteobacteria bacterium]|nr:flagellar M-ring protein FliF [Rhodobiaceae bacterium]MBO6543746.1 flagellar M-ring protein FliF [Alphaproteobacteria bacterium]MBO6629573.1 flagellar M-ring protein FliF [Alphaproteobacteria bacterium]
MDGGSVDSFTEFLKSLGPARILSLGLVAIGLLGFFAYVGLRVSEAPMSLLYADLTSDDAAQIITQLETQSIPYELQGDGTKIFVPRDQALRLRMNMAEQGLPSGGAVGYEIFDNTDALGTTSFVQNLNYLRALEGELSRTIKAIDRVKAARVHLVLPEREVFSRERREPSASIVIRVSGEPLGRAQIRSIQHLTASAIDGLTPGNVSIVDEQGNLLASGAQDENEGLLSSSLDERNVAFERRLQAQIQTIVESIVGPDNSRIQVNAELDFNRITRTSDMFDPEGQVVRSTQTVEESSTSTDGVPNDAVTVGNAVPNAGLAEGEGAGSRDAQNRLEETVNYEISRTTQTEIIEAGSVKRLSVAVAVDGIYTGNDEAGATYSPRTEEELTKIAALVRSAIGFNETRGDVVEVVNIRFASRTLPEPLGEMEEPFLGLTKADYMRMGETGLLALVSLLVLLFVVRPLVRGIINPAPSSEQLALAGAGNVGADGLALPAGAGQAQLTGPNQTGQPAVGPDGEPLPQKSAVEQMIDIAQVEGKVKESSVKKVGELVANHPDETISILRSWLHESQ